MISKFFPTHIKKITNRIIEIVNENPLLSLIEIKNKIQSDFVNYNIHANESKIDNIIRNELENPHQVVVHTYKYRTESQSDSNRLVKVFK